MLPNVHYRSTLNHELSSILFMDCVHSITTISSPEFNKIKKIYFMNFAIFLFLKKIGFIMLVKIAF